MAENTENEPKKYEDRDQDDSPKYIVKKYVPILNSQRMAE